MKSLILIVCFVFSALNVDQGAQGHRPLALGLPTVSKFPKISEIWFGIESTKKKKRFEKVPNVCKWLNICLKYYFDRGGSVGGSNGNASGNASGNKFSNEF